MPEAEPEAPVSVHLTPRERASKWEPVLYTHGWAVQSTHTERRARLEAFHPSGAVVMVTSGGAGRATNGHTKFYVLKAWDGPAVWLGVRKAGFEEFISTRTISGYQRRAQSKCRCLTGANRPKVRYTTARRAATAMEEARRQRAREGTLERAECRLYRCPDDDRVWHTSSRPSWRKAAGESRLWDSP